MGSTRVVGMRLKTHDIVDVGKAVEELLQLTLRVEEIASFELEVCVVARRAGRWRLLVYRNRRKSISQ